MATSTAIQLRLEDADDFIGHEWIAHDPDTGSDWRVSYDDGRPVRAGDYKTAERITSERYGRDVERV